MIFMVHREKTFSSWKKTPVFSGCCTHSTVSMKVTGHSYEIAEAFMEPVPGLMETQDRDTAGWDLAHISITDILLGLTTDLWACRRGC